MKIRGLVRVVIFISLTLIIMPGFATAADMQEGTVTINIDVNAPGDAKDVRLWIPYPVSDNYQIISEMGVEGNYRESGIYRDSEQGSLSYYAQWDDPASKRTVTMKFKAQAKERSVPSLKETETPFPLEVLRYLRATQYTPTDGEVAVIAKEVTKGKRTVLAKARAIYDWVVDNTYRDPNVKGCGTGSVERMLTERGGKCADISSVYVAIARAAGIPSREVFGLRLGKKPEQDMTGGYHCWAEFYLPGTGWVPVDPADVRKMMLVEGLKQGDKKAEEYREYFFGKVDTYRIALVWGGREVFLSPRQSSGPVNYYMYPYAEVDGKPLDYLDPKTFTYSVQFKEL